MPPIYWLLRLFAPVLCWLRLHCFGALLVLVVLVVLLVVVLFPFGRCDKKKGRTVLARPLFVRGLWACYMLINSSR